MNKQSDSKTLFSVKSLSLSLLALSCLGACSPGMIPYLGVPQREVFLPPQSNPVASPMASLSPEPGFEPLEPIPNLDPKVLFIARVSPRWVYPEEVLVLQGAALELIGPDLDYQLSWYNWKTESRIPANIVEKTAQVIRIIVPASLIEQDVSLQLLEGSKIKQSFPVMVLRPTSISPIPAFTPVPEPTALATQSPEPSSTPDPGLSPEPVPTASAEPTVSPSVEPTVAPSAEPSAEASSSASPSPQPSDSGI